MSTPKAPSRRRFLRTSRDAGLLALLASTFASRSEAAEAAKGGGSITMMKGQVFVNGKQASNATVVPINAEVKTGKRSMVAFTAGGDAHVLKANTAIQLEGSGGLTDQLRLLTGALMSAWGERPNGRQAKLSTGTATIGIRGTVTFTTPNRFSLLQGKVEYTYKDSNGNTRTLALARDTATGKPVSVDETGAQIAWVPPITAQESAVLKETIKAAVLEQKIQEAVAAGQPPPTMEDIDAIIEADPEIKSAIQKIETVIQDIQKNPAPEIDVEDIDTWTPPDPDNNGSS